MTADNMPDFDSMSPEEIMAWMETLAKRQGASEGFTTAADAEIPEIDPDTIIIDEPGYVPYGEEARAVPPKQEPAPAVAALSTDETPTTPQPTFESGGLAWLESLAAQESDQLFNLDLSTVPELDEQPASASVDPVSWLEELARSEGELNLPGITGAGPRSTPPAQRESLEWLETLARQQGAPQDELTTKADVEVGAFDEKAAEEEKYTPFSFETPLTPRGQTTLGAPPTPPPAPTNPAHWLQSLAAEEGYDEQGVRESRKAAPAEPQPALDAQSEEAEAAVLESIEQAIADGSVTPEQMQHWLDHQTERVVEELIESPAQMEDVEFALEDEAPAVPAEIPSWLIEQVGAPPVPEPPPEAPGRPPLESLFEAPPGEPADIPDWLKDESFEAGTSDLEVIFAEASEPFIAEEAAAPESITAPPVQIDAADPWVEAFEQEYAGQAPDLDAIPDWYERNINDPERLARVEALMGAAESPAAALLPQETELPAGQPQPVPTWMIAAESEAAASDEIPDWLREVEAAVSPDDIPDWLQETEPEPAPPAPAAASPAATSPSTPRPAPAPRATFEGTPDLESARSKHKTGDLHGAMLEYEALIRANQHLEDVVDDLTGLVRVHKHEPLVYRVLGDGLMRQGKLQAALDTYREALNQL